MWWATVRGKFIIVIELNPALRHASGGYTTPVPRAQQVDTLLASSWYTLAKFVSTGAT